MKKAKRSLNTFEILLIVMVLVAIATVFLNGRPYIDKEGNQAAIVGATLSSTLLAPLHGFQDAIEVISFVFCLGAFLAIVTATGALETGIHSLVKKLKGKELILVPVLMTLFSIGGTTYGMGEETVGFYILLAATMTAAGMDPMVGCATVLLGAGTGCLGSTINPFATGAAVAAATVDVNMGITYAVGLIVWLAALLISIWYVMSYAKKVMHNKGSILTAEQIEECKKAYGTTTISEDEKLTGKQKVVLWLFALTFVVMILGFIPWGDLNPAVADFFKPTEVFLGASLGSWWFFQAAMWFMLMGLIIGIIGLEDTSKLPDLVISGICDMVSVNLVIALARATSVIMSETGMGTWLVRTSVKALSESGIPAGLFGLADYILHIGLSFLVPSSSGLAGLSSPIVSPVVKGLGWSVETSIMINVAANGLVNLFTPTCGFIMGGLAVARVPYATYLNWVKKLLVILAVVIAIILVAAMMIL